MCLKCNFTYLECKCEKICFRYCTGEINVTCGRTLESEQLLDGFCRKCFSDTDPRDSSPLHERRQGQYFAYEIKRYSRDKEAQAEAERMVSRSTEVLNIPGEEFGRFEPGAETICGKDYLEIVERLLNKYLLPYFWTRFDEGGERLNQARGLILRLEEVRAACLVLASADHFDDVEDALAAMGASPKAIFTPLEASSTDDYDLVCGICSFNISSIISDEQYGQLVKTSCNHFFHQVCLERWSKHKRTCPMCRSNIAGPIPAKLCFMGKHKIPRWLQELVKQQPQPSMTLDVEKPTEKDMKQLLARRNQACEDCGEIFSLLREARERVDENGTIVANHEYNETALFEETSERNVRMFKEHDQELLKNVRQGKEVARRMQGELFNARQRLNESVAKLCDIQQDYDQRLDDLIAAEDAFQAAQKLFETNSINTNPVTEEA
jgi:hypothetical protein